MTKERGLHFGNGKFIRSFSTSIFSDHRISVKLNWLSIDFPNTAFIQRRDSHEAQ